MPKTPDAYIVLHARFFDGVTAAEHPVVAVLDAANRLLTLRSPTHPALMPDILAQWSMRDLCHPSNPASPYCELRNACAPDARLMIPDQDGLEQLQNILPRLTPLNNNRAGITRKMLGWGIGAAAAIVLMLTLVLPRMADGLAHYIPPATATSIGRTIVSQIAWLSADKGAATACTAPAGHAALAALTTRLTDGLDLPYPVSVTVLRNPAINALATPGGHIVIFSGLIRQTDTPEHLAAVLAHELGHVVSRDPLRIVLRSVGTTGILSLVLGDVTGGAAMALAAQHLLTARHTRNAEAAADEFALQRLRQSNLPPSALATFFDSLAGTGAHTAHPLPLLDDHPDHAARMALARSAEPATSVTPALSPAQWQALRQICQNG